MNVYDIYYQNQIGNGRGVSNVYVGAPRMRGHGLGSWFSGIFRSAMPLLTKAARAVGKEALRTGVNILDDVTENRMSFKESFDNRMNESGRNLKRKATEKIHKMMEGSGYYSLPRKRRAQYRRGLSRIRTSGIRLSRKRKSKVRKRKRRRKVKTSSKNKNLKKKLSERKQLERKPTEEREN